MGDSALERIEDCQECIRTDLTDIKLRMQGLEGGMTRMMEHIEREELILRGDGSVEKPGMVLRLDRLEQTEQVRRWSLRTMWIALMGMIVKLVYDLIDK